MKPKEYEKLPAGTKVVVNSFGKVRHGTIIKRLETFRHGQHLYNVVSFGDGHTPSDIAPMFIELDKE